MRMQHGKLTLEAIEGAHGDIAQRIALELVEAMEQRAELLEALKGVMYWDNGKSEWDIAREAIIKAEAAD